MPELVSVLIPAYNAEKWIADAIGSALAQDWQRKEIIVVNDGSTDHTLEIARQFEAPNVKVVTQDNTGASASRNKALSLSQGDYIQWLDADDLLAPGKISRQMEVVRAASGEMQVYSSAFGVFHYRRERAKFRPNSIWQDLMPIEWILNNFTEHVWMFPGAWLISRTLTESVGPWDERLSLNDDGEYFCRVVLASEKVRFVRSAVCYYRNSGYAQLSRDTSERGLQSLVLSLRLCIQHVRAVEDSERTRKASVALLQMYLPYFFPRKVKLLEELNELALELGGCLIPPKRDWKTEQLEKMLGHRRAESFITSLRKVGLATAVKWDELMFKRIQS